MTDIVGRLRATQLDKDNFPRMKQEKWLPVGLALEAADEIERLRAALAPFAEIAERLSWDKYEDDDMRLGDHIIEAPADDIAPGAFYCLMIGSFREATKALTGRETDR